MCLPLFLKGYGLLREAAKKSYIMAWPLNKVWGGGKGRATKKKVLLKLEKKNPKNVATKPSCIFVTPQIFFTPLDFCMISP